MVSRCEDGAVTGEFLDELPHFHLDTFSKLEEHSGRFAEVSESDVEKLIEDPGRKNDVLRLEISQKFLVEESQEIREIEKIPPTEFYLSQFILAAGPRLKKIMTRHLSTEVWLVLNAI